VGTEDQLLRESVLKQCAGLRNLMADIPKDAPNQSKFNNWIGDIKAGVDSDAEAAITVFMLYTANSERHQTGLAASS
jgi:hypothetical protein